MRPPTKTMSALSLAFPLLLLLGACSETTTAPHTVLVRVTPADGTIGVSLDSPIVLEFGTAVDRATVQGGVHLIAESDMHGSCPVDSMGRHGTMDAVMRDPAMLSHMDQYHSTHGRCTWNGTGTICTFMPDSLMHAGTRYMIHMSGDMVRMMQQRGGPMMGGMMNGSGDRMTHFTTGPS